MAEEFNEDYFIHTTGEEFIWRHLFAEDFEKPIQVTVGFFDQQENELVKSSDLTDITTEPTQDDGQGNEATYTRQTVQFASEFDVYLNADGNWEAQISVDPTFDVSGNTESVMSYFVAVEFGSTESTNGEGDIHLLWTGPLNQRYDLRKMDEFTKEGAFVGIDGDNQ